jgi:hypothetical protein
MESITNTTIFDQLQTVQNERFASGFSVFNFEEQEHLVDNVSGRGYRSSMRISSAPVSPSQSPIFPPALERLHKNYRDAIGEYGKVRRKMDELDTAIESPSGSNVAKYTGVYQGSATKEEYEEAKKKYVNDLRAKMKPKYSTAYREAQANVDTSFNSYKKEFMKLNPDFPPPAPFTPY